MRVEVREAQVVDRADMIRHLQRASDTVRASVPPRPEYAGIVVLLALLVIAESVFILGLVA